MNMKNRPLICMDCGELLEFCDCNCKKPLILLINPPFQKVIKKV